MEVHLVHFNKKYGSYKKAVNKTDGLAVVTFFIQGRGDKHDYDFSKISNYVPKVHQALSRYTIDSGNSARYTFVGVMDFIQVIDSIIDCLQWMKSQELSKHYYSYHGSLTTPPYDESVTWIIYKTPIFVARRQVGDIKPVQDSKNINPSQSILSIG